LYTQQKYNLFREETEGYSKLIAELSELPAATDYTSTRGCKAASEVIQNLQSLIGYFDLDPNRVLDCTHHLARVRRLGAHTAASAAIVAAAARTRAEKRRVCSAPAAWLCA
jgi:hypothetical protein